MCVARIFIGVKFNRELAIGAFHFFVGRVAFDAQDFVVIALLGHYTVNISRRTKAFRPKCLSAYCAEPLETTTLDGRSRRSCNRYPRRVWRKTVPSGTSALGSRAIASCRFGSNFFPSA